MARAGSHVRRRWTLSVLTICVVAGFLFVASAVSSAGSDLRPAGGDVGSLLQERSHRIDDRRSEARSLRREIEDLSASVKSGTLDDLVAKAEELEGPTGLEEARGPGVRVTLTDAPRSVEVPGLDPNALVVHQQDIQGYVNALWAGGAEAISLQGQRLIATTGIRCVGSTVVLDGVPYSPPYVIEAIGDVTGMNDALRTSPRTVTYAQYADRYQLGLRIETVNQLVAKPYAGTVGLSHARAVG